MSMSPRPPASRRTKATAAGLFVAVSALAGVVVAGIALPAAAAMGAGAKQAVATYDSLPSAFTAPPLAQQSVIKAANGEDIAVLYSQNRIEVPLDAINPIMQHAIVAIEDSRFYEHNGVDLKGTARALANNAAGEDVQGASTLTMQYIKNVLVNTADNQQQQNAAVSKNAGRKLQEIRYAVELEKQMSKPQILNNYLNIAYFGAGAYGVEAASQRYFSKPASQLSLTEAATLAGIVQSPSSYDPTLDPAAAQTRRDEVLKRMLELGYISQGEYDTAVARPIGDDLRPAERPNGCAASAYPYFCDYAMRQVLSDPRLGATLDERKQYLNNGGLTITTTLDIVAQDAANEAVNSAIPPDDESQKAAAIAMVRPGTGEVTAMTQNTTWGEGPGKTTINYSVDQADGGGAGMQAGSTFKIFTVANALQNNYDPNKKVNSPARITVPAGTWGCGEGSWFESFDARNSSEWGGTYDMWTATALSANTYFLQVESQTGLCSTVEMAKRAGIHSATGVPVDPVQTFTLGVTEVSPLTVANAYATFAAHGNRCEPRAWTSMRDRNGKELTTQATCEQAIPRDIADATTAVMSGTIDGSVGARTGKNMSLGGQESAGKTGTSDNSSAVWFAGYTPQMSAAVWVGDPRGGFQYPMNDITINGSFYHELYGGELPGPIWKKAMQGALSEVPYERFDLQSKYGMKSVQQGGGPGTAKTGSSSSASPNPYGTGSGSGNSGTGNSGNYNNGTQNYYGN